MTDYIRDIMDPEHPYTLEQLKVVEEDKIIVSDDGYYCQIVVQYTPTVPHCSLATLIGGDFPSIYVCASASLSLFWSHGVVGNGVENGRMDDIQSSGWHHCGKILNLRSPRPCTPGRDKGKLV